MIICGVDIGNSTTEAVIFDTDKNNFVSYGIVPTTGIKGTKDNKDGIILCLNSAVKEAGLKISDIDKILINEASPVISKMSTDIVSKTTVIGSAMIGHNPDTPGGSGIGIGYTVDINNLKNENKDYIIVINDTPFSEAASIINKAAESMSITGIIAKNDDGVLISNRLIKKIPIVDEVRQIEKVPIGTLAALEVAENAQAIKVLSNPYGIASVLKLTPDETKSVIPIAKSLMGLKSGVIIKNDNSSVEAEKIDTGKLYITSENGDFSVNVSDGADIINELVEKSGKIFDVNGEKNTNTGKMFDNIKKNTAELTGQDTLSVKISDITATDTLAPIQVSGGIADEYAMESVVMLSAMVKTSYLPIKELAELLKEETGIFVEISGKEADNAIIGALTTKGAEKPIAILDLGGGSTDAAIMDKDGNIKSVHTAGAGEMVTTIIDLELALNDRNLAENIKKYPLCKVETFNMLRFEDGSVKFTEAALPPELYKRVVIITEDKLIPINKKNLSLEQIALTRREAKKKVFCGNAKKALKKLCNNLRELEYIVLIGGSALDFEIPNLINEEMIKYNIVCGQGNVLNKFGPRAAVATGLILINNEQ